MRMHVDEAGRDELAAPVDDACPIRVEIRADRGDATVAQQHVALVQAFAVADQHGGVADQHRRAGRHRVSAGIRRFRCLDRQGQRDRGGDGVGRQSHVRFSCEEKPTMPDAIRLARSDGHGWRLCGRGSSRAPEMVKHGDRAAAGSIRVHQRAVHVVGGLPAGVMQ